MGVKLSPETGGAQELGELPPHTEISSPGVSPVNGAQPLADGMGASGVTLPSSGEQVAFYQGPPRDSVFTHHRPQGTANSCQTTPWDVEEDKAVSRAL